MAMNFRLKDFDGPLDLLLHLVTKAQVDIRDIFISEITDQYIAFVRGADDLDMDDASEFLVMAATLLEIKSRAMLPKPPEPREGEEDPEQELIRRLEEYRRFKETAVAMQGFENAAKGLFTKLPDEFPLPPPEIELVGLSLQGLVDAFARIWARKPDAEDDRGENRYAARDIRRDEHSVQECMLTLLQGLRRRGSLRFEDAVSPARTREEVVTLFLALLELMRLGRVRAEQRDSLGGIVLLPGEGRSKEETPDE